MKWLQNAKHRKVVVVARRVKLKEGGTITVPAIVFDYMEDTGQMQHEPFSKSHLLYEAEWQAEIMEYESSCAFEYHPNSKRALIRFVDRLQAEGLKAQPDFEI